MIGQDIELIYSHTARKPPEVGDAPEPPEVLLLDSDDGRFPRFEPLAPVNCEGPDRVIIQRSPENPDRANV